MDSKPARPDANPFDDPVAARRYFRYWKTCLGKAVFALEIQALRELLDAPSPARVLDLGCGSGHFAIALARAGFQLAAVDASDAMLREARAGHGEDGRRVQWIQAKMECLPFPDHSFDVVVQIVSLEFALDWRTALGEIRRVVRPGGSYIVGLACHKSLFSAMKPARRHLIQEIAPSGVTAALGWGPPDARREVVRIPPLCIPGMGAIAPWLDDRMGQLGFGGALCLYRFRAGTPVSAAPDAVSSAVTQRPGEFARREQR